MNADEARALLREMLLKAFLAETETPVDMMALLDALNPPAPVPPGKRR